MLNNMVTFQLFVEIVKNNQLYDSELTLEFPDDKNPLTKKLINSGNINKWPDKTKGDMQKILQTIEDNKK